MKICPTSKKLFCTAFFVEVHERFMDMVNKPGLHGCQDFAEAALGQTGWWLSAVSSTLSLFGMIFGGLGGLVRGSGGECLEGAGCCYPLGCSFGYH